MYIDTNLIVTKNTNYNQRISNVKSLTTLLII